MSNDKTPIVIMNSTIGSSVVSDCACADVRVSPCLLHPEMSKVMDGDCACASTQIVDIASIDMAGSWCTATEVQTFSLPGGWHGFFIPDGSVSLAVLNQSAFNLWSCFNEPQQFEELKLNPNETQVLREMASAGLLQSLESPDVQLLTTNSQLSAWLHLTDRCNLRCAYCYLPHALEDMSQEIGYAAVDAIFRSAVEHDFPQVKIKYAGGEPLLRFPLILKLHQYAQELATENGLGLDGVVLSNGTLLTEDLIINLQSLDLQLMISLDGVGNWHNNQRPYASGRGTFKDVAEGIRLALDCGLAPQISITISGRNAAGLPKIVDWVLERNLPFSINFYRQNDFSIRYEDLEVEEEKIIAGMMATFEVIENNLPKHSILGSITDRANLALPHIKTCSVGDSYLVFNQYGQVSKCQMKINQSVTDVYATDPLESIRMDRTGVQNISVEEKESCWECQWKYWCAGGCPLDAYRVTGRFDSKSPNCNIYKAVFPEVLQLEGLRLLKNW